MAQLEAIDISHWQTGLSLSKANPGGAIFKATDGTNFVDSTCDGFVSDAKRLGIPWGVYHFAQNTGNMTAEADFFVKHTSGYVGHGMLVLDWEHGSLGNVSGAKSFLDRVYAKTGVRPLIYMSQSVAASYNWDSVQRDYALWVARYNESIGSTGGWPVTMWQYTSSGHVNGYSGSVDKDHFYGSRDTWAKFAGSSEPAPAPKPPPDGGGKVKVPRVDVDGVWGSGTTKQRQALLTNKGLYDGLIDGKLDHQNPYWRSSNPGLTSGWGWDSGYKNHSGSKTIRADQKRLKNKGHYKGTVDGLAGPEYFKAIQREQQTPVDGVVDHPSTMVKHMQSDGNAGKLA